MSSVALRDSPGSGLAMISCRYPHRAAVWHPCSPRGGTRIAGTPAAPPIDIGGAILRIARGGSMNRTLATLAALGVATSVVLAADVMGQEVTVPNSGQGHPVYGRIVAVEQRSSLVALVTLDNGIQLSVPASTQLSANEPRTDATVA